MPGFCVRNPAIAAAFVLGFLFPRPATQNSVPTLAMIESHFSHAQFNGTGPPAKVIYARDRSWYYIIVSGNHRFDVYGIRGGAATPLGATRVNGNAGELFVKESKRFDRIELRDRGQTVESAAIK